MDDRARTRLTPAAFRAALEAVPLAERDGWLDATLGLAGVAPDDATTLPRGCVPYLPAPVARLVELVDHARITATDTFVDVGAGIGRAIAAVHLLTGATAIGLEVQPALVQHARALAAILPRISFIEGDAEDTVQTVAGDVFFLYCPFSGERLARVLAHLERLARTRPLRVGCLDVPLPDCAWLAHVAEPSPGLDIYRSR